MNCIFNSKIEEKKSDLNEKTILRIELHEIWPKYQHITICLLLPSHTDSPGFEFQCMRPVGSSFISVVHSLLDRRRF